METKLVTPPTEEPITLEEAKSHLRVTHSLEDDIIEDLITDAREWCEDFDNKAYLTQTRILPLKEKKYKPIKVPRPPLQSVEKIVVVDKDNTEHEVTDYEVDKISEPGRLLINEYPNVDQKEMNPVQITYKAGYESKEDVPGKVKRAIRLLLGHWYNNREAAQSGTVNREIAMGVKNILNDRVVPV